MSSALIESQPLASPAARPVAYSPLQKLIKLADRVTVPPRTWFAITCVLLSISGGVRFWRDMQFQAISKEGATSPISLKELPKVFGAWNAVEGTDVELDPEIARIAGSSQHVIRTYRDSKSGEDVVVLVLYGLADGVFAHTPDKCYPSAGYQKLIGLESKDRTIELPLAKKPLNFSTAYFGKQVAGMMNCVEVCWTFRHNGDWLPDVANRWKSFRYHPGMLKIQVQRQNCEQAGQESSIDSLLKGLGDEIEEGIANRDASRARGATPAP